MRHKEDQMNRTDIVRRDDLRFQDGVCAEETRAERIERLACARYRGSARGMDDLLARMVEDGVQDRLAEAMWRAFQAPERSQAAGLRALRAYLRAAAERYVERDKEAERA